MSELPDFVVLAVDDNEANIDILVDLLGDTYEVQVALDGKSALESVEQSIPDIILLDIVMPDMDGYEVCRQLKTDPRYQMIPLIFLTAKTETAAEEKGLSLGAVDYITKPFSPELVKARVKNHLELKKHKDNLEKLVEERTKQLALTQEVTVYSLASLAETRDPDTGGHILRTQRYVRELAINLNENTVFNNKLSDREIQLLFLSAPLHDIGKVGIQDSILNKPGKLTAEEFEIMKTHTDIGKMTLLNAAAKLGNDSFLQHACDIAYTHHEKWNGTGYPQGLSGDNIPLGGRMMALADVYDALISKRIYKPPFDHKKSIAIIIEGRGSHFDPIIVDIFVQNESRFKEIAYEFADTEEERQSL